MEKRRFSFFGRKENRNADVSVAEEPQYTTEFSTQLADVLFSIDKVTEDKVMEITTAASALDYIGNNVAATPVYLYKRNPDGSVDKLEDDYRVKLLNREANAWLKGSDLKKQMAKDFKLHGRSYVAKIEEGNKVLELHPLPARAVEIKRTIQNGFRAVDAEIIYTYDGDNVINEKKEVTFKPHQLVIATDNSSDGLMGYGVLKTGQAIFKEALGEMDYTNNYYGRGGMPHLLLKVKGRLTEGQANELSSQFTAEHGGAKNSHKPFVVEDDMEITPVNLPDPKLNENRVAISKEICKLFNIHYSILTGENQNNSDLEQNMLSFLVNCLRPVFEGLEAAFDKSLLLEKEKNNGYFFQFDTAEIVRTTANEQMNYVATGLKSGVLTLNQAKAALNLPRLPKDFTAFAPGTLVVDENGNYVGQGLDANSDEAEASGDTAEGVDVDETNEQN